MIAAIDWLKSREMYIKTMERLKAVKEGIKKSIKVFKAKYFSKESLFMTKVKSLYKTIKASLKK
jgi:Holliday junction resolvasome RuvABC endonuclease subunit